MANKETQEALNYMFGCAMTKDDITDYEEKRMIECSDIIKKAIDDLELYKKAVEILIKQSMCNYTYDAWEKRILQLARKELENGK